MEGPVQPPKLALWEVMEAPALHICFWRWEVLGPLPQNHVKHQGDLCVLERWELMGAPGQTPKPLKAS